MTPEERKQQRKVRQQQRRKQQRGKLLRTVLGIALPAACLVLVLIFLLPRIELPGSTKPTGEVTEETTVIHLAAAGDLNVNEAVVNAGGAGRDYTKALMDVAHLFADADVSMLNFEGNFYGAPYGSDRSAPQELAQALAAAGVDYLQLANSFSIYKGMDGLRTTIDAVRLAGMTPLGVYGTYQQAQEGKGYTLCNIRGVKIAFVAFTKGMDGMALPPGNEGCVNLLYTDYSTDYRKVDTKGISRVLEAAAKEQPDLTVALVHWGSEFNDNISDTQTQIAKLMQSKGVDAIIGTHSHYVQKIEFDRSTGQFIAYSLGDFMSDAQRAGSEYSIILNLEITKNNLTGETKITNYRYTPIFILNEADQPLRVVRIKEAMKAYEENYIDRISKESYDAMDYALKRIEARVNGK
ncbi:MAG: CapA family protein [Oscillospiraceae bacterium]|nr:CapA family protein [Oscillospiraceae bacterium]